MTRYEPIPLITLLVGKAVVVVPGKEGEAGGCGDSSGGGGMGSEGTLSCSLGLSSLSLSLH